MPNIDDDLPFNKALDNAFRSSREVDLWLVFIALEEFLRTVPKILKLQQRSLAYTRIIERLAPTNILNLDSPEKSKLWNYFPKDFLVHVFRNQAVHPLMGEQVANQLFRIASNKSLFDHMKKFFCILFIAPLKSPEEAEILITKLLTDTKTLNPSQRIDILKSFYETNKLDMDAFILQRAPHLLSGVRLLCAKKDVFNAHFLNAIASTNPRCQRELSALIKKKGMDVKNDFLTTLSFAMSDKNLERRATLLLTLLRDCPDELLATIPQPNQTKRALLEAIRAGVKKARIESTEPPDYCQTFSHLMKNPSQSQLVHFFKTSSTWSMRPGLTKKALDLADFTKLSIVERFRKRLKSKDESDERRPPSP